VHHGGERIQMESGGVLTNVSEEFRQCGNRWL
jgi:hypothetical protein